MLRSLSLGDWKSFGPNASGKSNALDALRFLQGAALDFPIGDVLRGRSEGQRQIWPPIRGGIAEAAHVSTDRFTLETVWELPTDVLTHRIEVSVANDVAIEMEDLDDEDGKYLFSTYAPALGNAMGRVDGGGLRVALRAAGEHRCAPGDPSHPKRAARNGIFRHSTRSISDGTLRFLGQIATLLTSPGGRARHRFFGNSQAL